MEEKAVGLKLPGQREERLGGWTPGFLEEETREEGGGN